MRYIRYGVLGVIALALVVVAVANRQVVAVRLLPDELGQGIGLNIALELPLYLIMLISVGVGVLIGFVWEWVREYRFRAEGARAKREASRMGREVAKLKTGDESGDEVLAILDASEKGR